MRIRLGLFKTPGSEETPQAVATVQAVKRLGGIYPRATNRAKPGNSIFVMTYFIDWKAMKSIHL
jgi:hypothetical protein